MLFNSTPKNISTIPKINKTIEVNNVAGIFGLHLAPPFTLQIPPIQNNNNTAVITEINRLIMIKIFICLLFFKLIFIPKGIFINNIDAGKKNSTKNKSIYLKKAI